MPLLPSVRDSLGLTSVETGLLLTTTTLAMLASAMPIGYAANRFGTRAPLLVAATMMPLGLVAQAVAGGLGPLLAARLLFGLSFGILWVIGPARAAANGRGAGGTGPLIAASGAGWLVGPIVAGLIADAVGWRVASVVLAVADAPPDPARRPLRRAADRRTAAREPPPAGVARARAPQPRDRRRGARQRPPRRRRRRLGPAPATRARGQRPVGGRDRARLRALGRRLDRRRGGSRPDARLGGAPAWCRPRRRGPRRRHGCCRRSGSRRLPLSPSSSSRPRAAR